MRWGSNNRNNKQSKREEILEAVKDAINAVSDVEGALSDVKSSIEDCYNEEFTNTQKMLVLREMQRMYDEVLYGNAGYSTKSHADKWTYFCEMLYRRGVHIQSQDLMREELIYERQKK